MQIKTFAAAAAFAASAALASVTVAAPASAQTAGQPAAAQPAPLPLTGPAVPGLCFLSDREVYAGSTVGKYVLNRLQQLAQQAQAEIDTQRTALQTDAKAFDAARSTLPPDQADQRAAQLNLRQRELERLADQRQHELQATQQQGVQTIGRYVAPILHQVVAEHNCSVVLSDSAVDDIAPSMDLSPAVIEHLNTTIQQFPLDRVHLDAAAGAGPQE